jgi:hypothetical protein
MPEDLPHRAVELAKAAEPGREGHLGDRQVGVVQQAPGEMRPPRASELIRRHPEMVVEQPPQMTRRHPAPRADGGLRGLVQHPADDQLDRPADELGRVLAHLSGHPVRPAAQTGPISRGGRGFAPQPGRQ